MFPQKDYLTSGLTPAVQPSCLPHFVSGGIHYFLLNIKIPAAEGIFLAHADLHY